jgi:hypothetical protein
VRDCCTPIKYPIHPQSQVLLIDLDSCRWTHHYLQIPIDSYPFLAIIVAVFVVVVAYIGRTVVDDRQELPQIIAGNASVGLPLQFLPQRHQQSLVLHLPEIMQSP